MGFDFERFPDTCIEEELVCSICKGVLEDPLQAPECEHAFCRACIEQWLENHSICPQDRTHLTKSMLESVPRITKNLLSRLDITCEFETNGCKQVVKLENLVGHIRDCEFNPARPVKCEKGCGFMLPFNEIDKHNCILELRKYIDETNAMWEKERAFLFRIISSNCRESQREEVSNFQAAITPWFTKFPLAKITRWGALISTPDFELQQMVRTQMMDARCPTETLTDLMHNSHERQWPIGLNSLEVRQRSHNSYNNYVLRKIGNQNAVLCLARENEHMNPDQILEPGFIMIFAHGVEEFVPEELSRSLRQTHI